MLGGPPERFRFGRFEADVATGELLKSGRRIHIQEKPFQILSILLARAGLIVTREELGQQLWPATHVAVDLSLNTAVKKLRVALGDNARRPHFIETIAHRGYRFLRQRLPAPSDGVSDPSTGGARVHVALAVLPFMNLNRDGEDLLSDAVTEQIMVRLARLRGSLTLIAPGPLTRYKETSRSTHQICHELKCDYLLTGSVMRADGQVRVNMKLIGEDQSCIWSDSCTHAETDSFTMQDEIAADVARAVSRVLAEATPKHIPHADACKLYDHGRHGLAASWERSKIEEKIEAFEHAIGADQQFALAYSGLAAALAKLGLIGEIRPAEVFPRCRSAAQHALELAPELCEAHTALAFVQQAYDLDRNAAEKSCRRALQIDPEFVMAHCIYARLCTAGGRHDEAVAALRRAREIDPFSPWVEMRLAEAWHFARRYDEALEAAHGAVRADSNFSWAHLVCGCVLEQMGELRASIGEYQLALRCSPSSAMALAHLGRGFALLGRRAEAARILDRMKAQYRSTYISPCWIALIYAALGESDAALDWLETAFADRCAWRTLCGVDPRFQSLAANPRFQDLLISLT